MNLYSVLNQDLRDLQKQKLAEAEAKKNKVIKESEEDEIGYRLVEIDEALKTAAPDEKEALEKEKAELLSRLNDISNKKECDSTIPEGEENTEECDKVPEEEGCKEECDKIPEGEDCKEDEECPDCNSTVEILKGLKDALDEDGELDIDAIKAKVEEAITSCNVPEPEEDIKEVPAEEEPLEDCSLKEHSGEDIDTVISLLQDEINIVKEEGSISDDLVVSKAEEIISILKGHPTEEGEECKNCKKEEDLQECEINAYKITRVSPSTKTYIIEAQTADGLKYIVGKNFNEETKELDEAEIIDNHDKALSTFKDLLKK